MSIQKKIGTPYLFLQPLKLATSNLVHNLGLGRTKIGGRSGPREHPNKIWYPLLISATVVASNFKFGMQLGFGTSVPKNNVQDQSWRGSGLREHSENVGTPYLFRQPLKLATSNLVHNLGLGLAYQKTTLRTKIGGGWARGVRKKN